MASRTGTLAVELLVEVLWLPRPLGCRDFDRLVVEEGGQRNHGLLAARFERRCIDDRLEDAAHLASRLGAAVELREPVVAASD